MASYLQRDAELRSMGYPTYDDYLASDLWLGIKEKVLLRDRNGCKLCGQKGDIIHPVSYGRDVLSGDANHLITTLCHKCHDKLVFSEGKVRRPLSRSVSYYYVLRDRRLRKESELRRAGKCTVCGHKMNKRRKPCTRCRNQAKIGACTPLGPDD